MRKDYVMMSESDNIQWTVRHPCSKLTVKLNEMQIEAYYDRFLALDTIEITFYDWLLYIVHEEYANDR